MIPFKNDIKKWFLEGTGEGATHMIIFRDLSDGHFEKIFVFEKEDSKKIFENHNDGIKYEAAECYSLRKNMEEQLNQGLVRNFD